MKISEEQHRRLDGQITYMRELRQPWWAVWQEISDYFLPRRYPWLIVTAANTQGRSGKAPSVRNSKLLGSTSTSALRTLATGMMNGITSPARPWFRLSLKYKKYEEPSHPVNVWLEAATKAMHKCMSGTNLYNALGILYLEWCAFGTGSMGIYENFDSVFRCRNFALGEFMITCDDEGQVDSHAREFIMPLYLLLRKWPDAELSPELLLKAKSDKPQERAHPVTVRHLIEKNKGEERFPGVRRSAKWREIYWVEGPEHMVLQAKGLDVLPTITPRWETYGADTYGSSPCMEAMPDVLQLQHLVKRRAQGLDKMVDPPMLAHSSLATKPKAFLPGGVTYVSTAELAQGARPTYQVNIPFQELHLDIEQTQQRIREVLFNDLFRMISDLQTVRSASEIDARREEKLVLLGPVLERFEAEGLRPTIERIFDIMDRADLFPPPPPELEGEEMEILYTGVLSDAQKAVGTVAVERWLAFIGNLVQIAPNVTQIPDYDEVTRYYADAIGVPAQLVKDKETAQAGMEQMDAAASLEQAATTGSQLAGGAQSLSATDVGGGQNALQALLGA
jgi:hypothetical protein